MIKIIKKRKDVPTVIEYDGRRYVLDMKTKVKASNDVVNHPAHYTSGGIETIDYMKAKMGREQFFGYLQGNIIKYISRYENKNGLEDLQKAQWYLTKLIEEMSHAKK
jgi:hypothetical protein